MISQQVCGGGRAEELSRCHARHMPVDRQWRQYWPAMFEGGRSLMVLSAGRARCPSNVAGWQEILTRRRKRCAEAAAGRGVGDGAHDKTQIDLSAFGVTNR